MPARSPIETMPARNLPVKDGAVEHVDAEPRLTDLSTQWTLVFQSRNGAPEEAHLAMSRLMCRYAGAVHRYLLKALKDPEAAAELDQEFALRFLRGDFRNGDPSRGRFRDYVKRAVQNLMKDHHRRRRPLQPLDTAMLDAPDDAESPAEQFERQFTQSWRNDLLDRSWTHVKDQEHQTGQPHHTVLRLRVENPALSSDQLAGQLAKKLGRPVTAGAFRQALQRARRSFTRHLLNEVVASIENPTSQAIEQELAELQLLEYCRAYLKKS